MCVHKHVGECVCARACESTRELVQAVPWEMGAEPAQGRRPTRFDLLFFSATPGRTQNKTWHSSAAAGRGLLAPLPPLPPQGSLDVRTLYWTVKILKDWVAILGKILKWVGQRSSFRPL